LLLLLLRVDEERFDRFYRTIDKPEATRNAACYLGKPMSASLTLSSPPTRPKTQYQPYLDGLRGVAILGVLADHFHVPLPPIIHVGPVGVRFFFILTGYFITLSLWKVKAAALENPSERGLEIVRYYFGRLLRIGPPFYLALLVGALLGIQEIHDNLFWLATFQTNNYIVHLGYWPTAISHFWSLAVQEQFYILWPVVVLTLPKRFFVPLMLGCVVFALGFRMTCILSGAPEVTRWVTLCGCLDSFAAGALIAYLKEGRLLEKIQLWPRAVLLVLPLAAIACYFLARFFTTLSHESAYLALAETCDALFLSWLLIASLNGIKSRYAQFLGWAPLIYLGRISYGVYVYHVFIIILVSPFLIANGLDIISRTAVLLAVTLLVSAVSWHWMEQPIIAWKNSLGHATRPIPAKAPVPAAEPDTVSVFA
jgi:peptidoglycan/LPS O-acetylase OafA/YrhL